MAKVKVVDNPNSKCVCGSWIEHWINFNEDKEDLPEGCPVISCNSKVRELTGIFVEVPIEKDTSLWVIPACRSCGDRKGHELEINDDLSLASANIEITCGQEVRKSKKL